jgi:hypothetical protein
LVKEQAIGLKRMVKVTDVPGKTKIGELIEAFDNCLPPLSEIEKREKAAHTLFWNPTRVIVIFDEKLFVMGMGLNCWVPEVASKLTSEDCEVSDCGPELFSPGPLSTLQAVILKKLMKRVMAFVNFMSPPQSV